MSGYFKSNFNYFFLLLTLLFITRGNSILIVNQSLNLKMFEEIYTTISPTCTITTFSRSNVDSECENDLGNYQKILGYNSFSSYINAQSFKTSGLNYHVSLFVDSEYHDFGDFLSIGLVILIIVAIIIILAWVPLLCCWRKRCCLYDECLVEDECCKIFWHVITYILAVIILTFLIVCVCFGDSFRGYMHGSACLFSKFMVHFLEGENADDLDISDSTVVDNIFRGLKTLGSNWGGTCKLLRLFYNLKDDFSKQINDMNLVFNNGNTTKQPNDNNTEQIITHSIIEQFYSTTTSLINDLYSISTITSSRPSNSSTILTPNFENQFKEKTDTSTLGGKIYNDYNNILVRLYTSQNDNIKSNLVSILNDNNFVNKFNNAFESITTFDNTVATASNVMITNFLNLKDYQLDVYQFMFLFISWLYLILFIITIIIYVIFVIKKFDQLYCTLVLFINILLILAVWEILNAAFFGGIRIICQEAPRALNFIFTGTYMVSGNTANYPAKFGKGDSTQAKLFDVCLNGDGDLMKLFFNDSDLTTLKNLKTVSTSNYLNISSLIDKSNLMFNPYDSVSSTNYLTAITQLEEMQNNLYLASDGFGDDDIKNMLNTIKNNLASTNCSVNTHYFVVKKSDCPSNSIISETIESNSISLSYCYIIQNLNNNTKAAYTGTSCDNNYINKVITFIKELNSLLENRIYKLKKLQKSYAETVYYLSKEITRISNNLNNTYRILTDDLKDATSNTTNCSSVRFDLINFSDYYSDKTEYRARIILIFSIFVGIFGFFIFYSFLIVLNSFYDLLDDERNSNDYGFNYSRYNAKKRRKSTRSSRYSYENEKEDEEEDEEDNYKKTPKKKHKKEVKKNYSRDSNDSDKPQKVEMSYLNKNKKKVEEEDDDDDYN